MEVTSATLVFFLGRGMGIPVTPKVKGGLGRSALCTKGGEDLPEISPRPCCKTKENKVKKKYYNSK